MFGDEAVERLSGNEHHVHERSVGGRPRQASRGRRRMAGPDGVKALASTFPASLPSRSIE
jgi:hypothetical protein